MGTSGTSEYLGSSFAKRMAGDARETLPPLPSGERAGVRGGSSDTWVCGIETYTPQMSFAYSLIVRSPEKNPLRAVFRIDMRVHSVCAFQVSAARCCVST
jgi:hypothetical protein